MSLDLYFSRGIMKGLGTVFMLRVPQEAGEGSSPRKLLGSYVDEIDYGLFKSKEAPSLNHAWQAEYFLSKAAEVPTLQGMALTDTVNLANFTQTYNVETKAGLNARRPFRERPSAAVLSWITASCGRRRSPSARGRRNSIFRAASSRPPMSILPRIPINITGSCSIPTGCSSIRS
jgi:hypothetical protein